MGFVSFEVSGKDPQKEILLKYDKIVLVGDPRDKKYGEVAEFLRGRGYEVVQVGHFGGGETKGVPTYRDVAEVPDRYLEILYVLRPSDEIPAVVDRIVESGKIPKVFWMHQGTRSGYARENLEPLGVTVIEDSDVVRKYREVFLEKDPVYEEILRFARLYARTQGYALNPDPVELDRIISGLANNQKTYGYRYCPCRPLSGTPGADTKKICPCYWHKEEIRRDGRCHCGLFWGAADKGGLKEQHPQFGKGENNGPERKG